MSQDAHTLLVIDRDEDVLAVIVDLLSDRDLAVDVAHDATEGVRRLHAARPAVVLCHVGLLHEDRGRLLRRVRSVAPRPHLVAMSASGLRAGRDEVDANLAKPFTRSQLLAAIELRPTPTIPRPGPGAPSRGAPRC